MQTSAVHKVLRRAPGEIHTWEKSPASWEFTVHFSPSLSWPKIVALRLDSKKRLPLEMNLHTHSHMNYVDIV